MNYYRLQQRFPDRGIPATWFITLPLRSPHRRGSAPVARGFPARGSRNPVRKLATSSSSECFVWEEEFDKAAYDSFEGLLVPYLEVIGELEVLAPHTC